MEHQIATVPDSLLSGQALFEALPGNSVLIKPGESGFLVVAATPLYLQQAGTVKDQLIGLPFGKRSLFRTDIPLQQIEASFKAVIRNKRPEEFEVNWPASVSNHEAPPAGLRISNTPVMDAGGMVTYIVHTIEETPRSEPETASSDRWAEVYEFFSTAPMIIGVLKGDDYIIELANEGLLEVWDRTADVIGKPLLSAIPELQQQGFIALLDDVRTTGNAFYAYEFPITLQRGGKEEVLYFDFVYKPIWEGEGKAGGIISVGHNVTKQVLAKKTVEESELKYRTLLETMNQGFCLLEILFDEAGNGIDFRYLETNSAFERQSGLKDAKGKRILELVPEFETYWCRTYGNVVQTGEPIRYINESKALGKWFDVYAFPVGVPGSATMAVFFTDITDQKKGEQSIRESEERFRKLADDSPMFVFIIDADPLAPVRYWNKSWLDYTGQSREEAIGRSWNGIIHPDDNPVVMSLYTPAFENKTPYFIPAIRVLRKDGAYHWYAFKGNPRYGPDGAFDGFVGVGFDIHEQKLAEEALQQSEARSRLAIESARLGTYEIDLASGNIVYSGRTAEIFGLAEKSIPYTVFQEAVCEDDRPVRERALEQAAMSGELFYEVRIQTPTHGLRWIRLNGKYSTANGERASLVGTVLDITEEKRIAELLEQKIEERTSELKQVNDQLKQFSYAASHDLQEPLRKISFFLNTLVSNISGGLNEENKKIVDRIQHTTGRMRGLIDDLLAYSNTTLGITGFQPVDLVRVVNDVTDDMEAAILTLGAKVSTAQLPVVNGDERQLRQLFQNLFSNALKYQKKGTIPEVSVSCTRVEGASKNPNPSQVIRDELFFEIRVQDNGIGFDPDDAEKIFRIFHRLHGKGDYEGTGVGLAIVQKVVENHRGYIWAEGHPGAGAAFIILLPANQ